MLNVNWTLNATWLKDGDRNTKYFHGRASQRKRRNTIKGVRDQAGIWHENEVQVARVFLEYYRTLFTTSNPSNIEEAVAPTPQVITQSMNNSLTREFTSAEVEHAIAQMSPSTAPGPDDDSLIFCKATLQDVEKLQDLLGTYERASGQQVNVTRPPFSLAKAPPSFTTGYPNFLEGPHYQTV
uniref:Uncharacterized protein n=1 Tax=Fagus sylvatica TaxID=28930 RepID=A0A2N9FPX8_FAGSY